MVPVCSQVNLNQNTDHINSVVFSICQVYNLKNWKEWSLKTYTGNIQMFDSHLYTEVVQIQGPCNFSICTNFFEVPWNRILNAYFCVTKRGMAYLFTNSSKRMRWEYPCRRMLMVSSKPVYRSCTRTLSWENFSASRSSLGLMQRTKWGCPTTILDRRSIREY